MAGNEELNKVLKSLLTKQSALQTVSDRTDENVVSVLTKQSTMQTKIDTLEATVKALSEKLDTMSLAKGTGKKTASKAIDPSVNVAPTKQVAPARMRDPWVTRLIKIEYEKNKNIDEFLKKYTDPADFDALKTKVDAVENEGTSYAGNVLEVLDTEYYKNSTAFGKRGLEFAKKIIEDHKADVKKFEDEAAVAVAAAKKKKAAETTSPAPASSGAADDFV